MKITDEELDLLKRLQPFFEKRMKAWLDGDWGIDDGCEPGIVIDAEFINIGRINGSRTPLRYPATIDDRNPERGLWGMVDWDLFSTHTPNDGDWYIFGMTDRRLSGFSTEWCLPHLAILKALCQQEGV